MNNAWYLKDKLVLTAGVTYVVAFLVLLAIRPFSGALFVALDDVLGTLPPLAAGLLGVLAGRRSQRNARGGWFLIGAGCLSWGIGELIWTFYEVVLGREIPFPSLADIGYLAAVPLLLAGILALTLPGDRLRLRVAMDAAAVVTAAGAVSWHFLLQPIFADTEAGLLEKLLGAAYPAGDLVLLFALIVALSRVRQGNAGVLLGVLSAGMAAFLVADSAFAYGTVRGGYAAGSWVDGSWVIGTSLFACAAYLQTKWQLVYAAGEEAGGPAWRQMIAFVLLPFLMVWLVLDADFVGSAMGPELVTSILFLAYVVLVVARQAMVFLDSVQMNRQLEALTAKLQAKAEFLSERLSEERTMADIDSLTGVLNRAAIVREMEQMIATAIVGHTAGAIGMVDVDSLKFINDRYGHLMGDEALRRVAAALSIEGTKVGRFGGDEFVVILPRAAEAQVEAYLALTNWRLEADDSPEGALRPGVSFGFASYPDESSSWRDLIDLADQRMYEEKKSKQARAVWDLAA